MVGVLEYHAENLGSNSAAESYDVLFQGAN